MFSVHGQEAAVRLLEAGLRGGRLHHAYLFVGPPHVGKTTLAVQLAQAAACDDGDARCEGRVAAGLHADVQILVVDSEASEGPRTSIGIDAVRALIASAHLRPYEGRRRVFIVQDAHRLSPDAANALLKVLEEPPSDVLFALLTDTADDVPPTVRSRCQTVELRPMPTSRVVEILRAEYGVDGEQAEVLGRLARGCLGWAIEASRDPAVLAGLHQRFEKISDVAEGDLESRFAYADEVARRYQRDRATGRAELFLWLRWLHDVLLIQQGQAEQLTNISWRETLERHARLLTPNQTVRWIRAVDDTVQALERNANPRLALEVLMLDAPQMQGAKSSGERVPG